MASDPRLIGERYFDAWTSRDFEAARGLLHDDMTFRGPFEQLNGADALIGSLRNVAGGLLDHVENRKVFTDGEDVCIAYDFVTATPAGTVPIFERYHVRDGKIDAIQTVFDTRPFAALREG
jgi:hypothetical protein